MAEICLRRRGNGMKRMSENNIKASNGHEMDMLAGMREDELLSE